MQLIYANRPGTPIAVVRTLSPAEADTLCRFYALGESTRQSTELITFAWQHRWWFACECRGPRALPPMLYIQRSYAGGLCLTSMSDRPGHDKRCPYATTNTHSVETSVDASPQLPPLGELFYRWFSGAKMNLVYPYTAGDMVTKQYASLREVSRSTPMGNGRQLHDYMRTHPKALPNLLKVLTNAEARRRTSKPETPPVWGLLLYVVPAMLNGELKVGDEALAFSPAQIHMPPGAVEAGGPLVTLIKYTADDTGQFAPTEVFAHPVYSTRQLVPIDYAHERRTFKTLLALQQKMCAEKDVVIAIRKTLPQQQAHDRGIAFQLHRVGPNGKPARELDVLTIDATQLLDRLPAESQPNDIVYHLVKNDVPFHDLDRKFYGILFARLLDGVNIPARNSTQSAASTPVAPAT